MKPSEYLRYDATALADLIRRGEVTSREVTEAAIDRASAVNPRLNAICHPQFAEAMDQGFSAEGPFAGVPLLLKDLAQEQAGHPCTYGSRALLKNVATRDSQFVRRAREAGLVFLGRTATPEFGLKAVTESALWAPAVTPGIPSARRVAPAAVLVLRSRLALCPWRVPTMAVAPFVFRPPTMACSG